jgi:hypothetical protein
MHWYKKHIQILNEKFQETAIPSDYKAHIDVTQHCSGSNNVLLQQNGRYYKICETVVSLSRMPFYTSNLHSTSLQ